MELTSTGRLKLLDQFSAMIPAAVKELFEKKHLYQSIALKPRDLIVAAVSGITATSLTKEMETLESIGWMIPGDHPSLANTEAVTSGAIAVQDAHVLVWFKTPDVKLFCNKCCRVEPFNSVDTHVLVSGAGGNSRAVQVFAFSFLCQSCKLVPEVFLVRREGFNLTLSGRAPIEYVEVPSCIPKPVQSFYRRGVIAFQCGEVLAGNFILRTVIEQWARKATNQETAIQADRVMEAYMESLPEDFKGRFPSMKELYGILSADIHGAKGSPEIFESAQEKIVEHFEARRLYKLPVQVENPIAD